MKKLISIILIAVMMLTAVSCTSKTPATDEQKESHTENQSETQKEEKEESLTQTNTDKITIIATLYPQYDFAKQIAGDKADVKLLLPPGTESHSFEPKPSDVLDIHHADLFIYTGPYMETWADRILDGIPTENNVHVLDVSKGITLVKTEEEHDHGDEHDHEEEHIEDDHDHDDEHVEEHEEHHGHHHEYDPHIWTNPVFAQVMVKNICDSLCEVDSENAEYYRANADKLTKELQALDQRFRTIVEHGNRKTIYFGGRFALYYFTTEYGLIPTSAYDNCSSETEPSIHDMTEMINEMKKQNIPVVFYEELTDPKVARTIHDETGAEMLLFHSCHNLSKDDYDAGVSYIELMNRNADNLEKAVA